MSNSRLKGSGVIELNQMTNIEVKLDAFMNKLRNNERRMHTTLEVGIVDEGENRKSVDEGLTHDGSYQVEEAQYLNANRSYTFKPNLNLPTHYTQVLRNHASLLIWRRSTARSKTWTEFANIMPHLGSNKPNHNLPTHGAEEVKYVNEQRSYHFKTNRNLPTHYNPALRNHENFSYGGGALHGPRQGQHPQQGYPQPPRFQQQHQGGEGRNEYQGQRRTQPFEEQMLQFMGDNKSLLQFHEKKLSDLEAFKSDTHMFQKNASASLKNLETQVGQLALNMPNQSKGTFPSDTQKNPKHCMEI